MFQVVVLVSEPTLDQWSAMTQAGKAICIRDNRMTHQLKPNRQLSHELYPRQWTFSNSDLVPYRPRLSDGPVRTVYDFPEELADASNCKVTIQAFEDHARRSFCQIVTGYHGQRIRPFRRTTGIAMDDGYVHPTVSHYSKSELGMVRLGMDGTEGLPLLQVQRAKIGVVDGLVTVTEQRLLYFEGAQLLEQRLSAMPTGLEDWNDALEALYLRRNCAATDRCRGHYYAN